MRRANKRGQRSASCVGWASKATLGNRISAVEAMCPAIAKWVRGSGHFEIGDQESFGFVGRALDYGGLVFEDDAAETLAEAMAALERGLAKQFTDEGIEIQ